MSDIVPPIDQARASDTIAANQILGPTDQPRRAAPFALARDGLAELKSSGVTGLHDDAGLMASLKQASELRRAIAAEMLQFYWQPCFGALTGRVEGYEALLRWRRVGKDIVPPTEMLAMARKGGFLDELDRMVLRCTCAAAAVWPRPLGISVILSEWWFSHDDLVDVMKRTLATTGLDADRLTIEVTEASVAAQPDHARGQIAGLRAMGVHVALDDFGSDHAALRHVTDFAIDKLKFGRTLIHALDHDPRARSDACGIAGFCKALGVGLCSAGVETHAQLTFLQEIGCDQVQGFLLGRPHGDIAWA